jgi:hypothetical protein
VAPALDNKTFHQESVLREDEQPSCVSFRQLPGISYLRTTTSWSMCTTTPSAVCRAVIVGWSSRAKGLVSVPAGDPTEAS